LRNVIRTALAICDGGVVRLRDLPSEVRDYEARDNASLEQSPRSASAKKEEMLRCIRDCDGNMSHAAARLGISRNTLYRRCKRLGIPSLRSRNPLG
jgi:transcriptional regulator of acetoin/glycerol metabolism